MNSWRLGVLAMILFGVLRSSVLHAQYQQPWNGEALTADPPAPIMARAVVRVALTVSNADSSIRFYRDLLQFTLVSDRTSPEMETTALTGVSGTRVRRVVLALGEEQLELLQFLDRPGRPAPAMMQSNDRWFQHVAIIVRHMDSAYATLRGAGVVHVSPAPQTLPASIPAAAGISAFYFRDPDGHPLEILAFPPDKGLAKWHRTTGSLFLGIDHSAIVVASTDRSLAFYQGLLGIPARGESLNQGPEQARLNNVPGVRLRITGLRAEHGPGVEFLDYRAPMNGRPYPRDARPNDLLHWHTQILVDDVSLALESVRRSGATIISTIPVSVDSSGRGYRRAVLVRDPDGHAIELIQR